MSFIAPDLWTDPFGPLLKVAPIMAATAVVMAFQEKRYRIAFFQFIADRGKDRGTIAATLRTVVIADFIFTATAAVAQPITGLFLVRRWTLHLALRDGNIKSLYQGVTYH